MTNTRISPPLLLAAFAAGSLSLAACSTEPEEVAEVPLDESSVPDGDAPIVGVPEKEGEASPATAIPDAPEGGEMEERGSGAEPGTPIKE